MWTAGERCITGPGQWCNSKEEIRRSQRLPSNSSCRPCRSISHLGRCRAGTELLATRQNGDMVAGTYNPGQPSAEGDDYTRADFTPALSGSSTSSAFLVRMRRTPLIEPAGQFGSSARASVPSGPTLPLLFGRGSMMAQSGGSSQLSVASGITVRATAIAAAMPAKTVGPGYNVTGGTFAQLAPFAISNGLWNNTIWPQLSGGTAATVNLSDPGCSCLRRLFPPRSPRSANNL